MKGRFFPILFSFGMLALLSGCAASQDAFHPKGDSLIAYRVTADQNGAVYPLPINADIPGELVFISFHGKVETGRLSAVLVDESGTILWNPGSFGESLSITDYVELPKSGVYRLGVQWEGSVQGFIEYWWRSIDQSANRTLSPMAYLGSIGMLLVALAYLLYTIIIRSPWKYLGFGAIAWIAAVFIKNLLASLSNQSVYQSVYQSLDWRLAGPVFYLYIGLLTGVTEVLLLWLFLRYTRFGKVGWKAALAFGVGFGVIEAFLLGINGVLYFQSITQADLDALTRTTWTSIVLASNPLVGLAPVSERFFTILIHIFCTTALFYSVNKEDWRLVVAAFLVKTGADALSAFAQNWGGLFDPARIWLIEGIIIAFGLLSLAGAYWVFKYYPDLPFVLPGEKKEPV